MNTETKKEENFADEAENVQNTVTEPAAETEAKVEPEFADEAAAVVISADKAKVEKTIRSNVYAAMSVGIVPVSLFDFAAVTAIQLNLVRQLSALYGVEFKEKIAKKIIIAATGAGATVLASPLIETAVIGIPLVGLPLAIGTKPILNAISTYALGQMFVTHFNRGGTFLSANMESMTEDFKAAYQNSREWLGNAISGKKASEPDSATVA